MLDASSGEATNSIIISNGEHYKQGGTMILCPKYQSYALQFMVVSFSPVEAGRLRKSPPTNKQSPDSIYNPVLPGLPVGGGCGLNNVINQMQW
jgi:hypothetical protein